MEMEHLMWEIIAVGRELRKKGKVIREEACKNTVHPAYRLRKLQRFSIRVTRNAHTHDLQC